MVHVEADMFFMHSGVYDWDGGRVANAHRWCADMVRTAMINGSDVVVSNTFTQKWELKNYIELAAQFNYDVQVIRCSADYGNVHDVPMEALNKMRARFENYEGELILQ
jgi:hypothetical protein